MASAAEAADRLVVGENDDFHWSFLQRVSKDTVVGKRHRWRRRIGCDPAAPTRVGQLLTVNSSCADASWPPAAITSSRVMSSGFFSMTTTGTIGLRPVATTAGTS